MPFTGLSPIPGASNVETGAKQGQEGGAVRGQIPFGLTPIDADKRQKISSEAYRGSPPHEPKDSTGTSKAAAHFIAPKAGSLRWRVLRFIIKQGSKGGTDEEIEIASGRKHQTISARRRELVLGGFVRWNGAKRINTSGSPASVHIATDKGMG